MEPTILHLSGWAGLYTACLSESEHLLPEPGTQVG